MKHLTFLLLALPLCGAAEPTRQEKLAALKTQAQASARAMVGDDHQKMVELTHPKLVKEGGGAAQMVKQLETLAERMRARWPTRTAVVEDPIGMAQGGSDLYGVVPFVLEMKNARLKAVMRSYLIGASSDGGRTWKFVDHMDAERRKQFFPDFPSDLKVPELGQPVYMKVD